MTKLSMENNYRIIMEENRKELRKKIIREVSGLFVAGYFMGLLTTIIVTIVYCWLRG